MCFDDLLHNSCAPIAVFYVVFVEQFSKFIVFREVFSQKLEFFFLYLCKLCLLNGGLHQNDAMFFC